MKKTRRILLVLACLAGLLLTSLPLAAADTGAERFGDLGNFKQTYPDMYADIDYAVRNDIFFGTYPTHFTPLADMTREMFVTVLGRLAEKNGESIADAAATFTDVRHGAYYEKYIAWGVANKIILGYNTWQFGVGDLVTREQAAALAARYATHIGLTLEPVDAEWESYRFEDAKDLDTISKWAYDACQATTKADVLPLHYRGIGGSEVDPITGGTIFWDGAVVYIEPQKPVIRAEAASIMAQLHRLQTGA